MVPNAKWNGRLADSFYYQEMLKEAKRMKYKHPCIVLYIVDWSDNIDPNNQSKNNRGSVWIKTVSTSSDPQNDNCPYNTYPIAVGEKVRCIKLCDSCYNN